MEVLAFILHAIEPVGPSVWPARPQHPFPEPAEPTGLMSLHAFSVSDCYAESSTPRPCLTDVGDAGPWIADSAVPQRSCWRDLYGGICTAFATRCQIHRYFGNAYSREMADLLDGTNGCGYSGSHLDLR